MDHKDVERIALDVMTTHGCHSAILYGSWARGLATPQSDVDILCVREAGPAFRDARVVDGIYIDAFVYPEADIATPQPSLLRVLGGTVIHETNGFGSALLAGLQELHDRGPAPIPDDERRAALLWSRKMIDRFQGQRGVEADYRRMQLLLQSLEDYFALRGAWFRGPKEAFAWLLQHDAPTYQRFERAAEPDTRDDAFAELVHAVYGPLADQTGSQTRSGLRDPEAGSVYGPLADQTGSQTRSGLRDPEAG
jgi:predicted nucleotidyltransferase